MRNERSYTKKNNEKYNRKSDRYRELEFERNKYKQEIARLKKKIQILSNPSAMDS